jgi:hypothetical protein
MSQNLRKIGKKRFGDDNESHRAQLLWSSCVALAVVIAALYEVSSPRPYMEHALSPQAQAQAANAFDRTPTGSFDMAEQSGRKAPDSSIQ